MLYRDAPKARWVFDPEGITFVDYPFFPATVYPSRRVDRRDIIDIDLSAPPPTVRVGRELLMVSAMHKEDLRQLATSGGIPLADRGDQVWSDILEPALDTQFDDDARRATYRRLHAVGLDASAVDGLRDRFVPALVAYNFTAPLWEWHHLGLFDLLEAIHPDVRYTPSTTTATYPSHYWEAMRIALLAADPN